MSNEEDRFRKMVEYSQDWFWEFDEKANFTYVSPQIKKLLGYDPIELLGLNAFDLMDPDEAERVHQRFDPIAKKYLPFNNLINTNRHKDGHEVVIESSATPIFDEAGQFRGYRGIDRDVTLREQVADELRNSKEKLQSIFDTSAEWIWEIDLSGRHTYSNQSLLNLLGYEPEEFVGKDYFGFLHEEDAQAVKKLFPKFIAEKRGWNGWVLRWRSRDGSYRFLESNAKPIINSEGEAVGFRGADRDITERKLMAENYRRLASLTSDYVHYCTRSGSSSYRVQWVDGAISPISGYRIKDVINMGCFLPLVHPDDQQNVSDHLLSLVPGDRKSIEFRIVTKQKKVRWVSEKSQCEAGQFEGELVLLGAVTDITERKQAEEALQANREMLVQTQQLAQVGSWQFDFARNQLEWSEETFRIFGMAPQAFAFSYEEFLKAVHPEDRAAVDFAYSTSLRDGQGSYEVGHRIIRQDTGDVRYVYEKCQHERDANGVVIRSTGMVQDVTERKINEVALLAATQAAEAANRSKGLFLAKVSHEIRTPMTSIIGFGELLEDTELNPEQQKYLAAINAAGSALTLLIDDVLDLTKVDSGELAIKLDEFRLHDFIAKIVSLQEPQAAVKNLSLRVRIDTAVPEVLVGDSLRIQQVLLNLLSNAIKFTEKGDVGIDVSLVEETDVRVLLDIAIKDTGIGVSPSQLERIFEPFTQAPGVNSHNYGGAGLGLSISRSLAALMGGSIRVESQLGTGSTFHFILPLKRKTDYGEGKAPDESDVQVWRGPALSLLLAEDNPVNAEFITTILENLGHKVAHADNGKAAIDLYKASDFDMVLMDIQMPVMDGVDALSIMRELEQLGGRTLTVIALTAFALIGDQQKYLEMGFDGYLSKPFTTRSLVDEMVRVLSSQASPVAEI